MVIDVNVTNFVAIIYDAVAFIFVFVLIFYWSDKKAMEKLTLKSKLHLFFIAIFLVGVGTAAILECGCLIPCKLECEHCKAWMEDRNYLIRLNNGEGENVLNLNIKKTSVKKEHADKLMRCGIKQKKQNRQDDKE